MLAGRCSHERMFRTNIPRAYIKCVGSPSAWLTTPEWDKMCREGLGLRGHERFCAPVVSPCVLQLIVNTRSAIYNMV